MVELADTLASGASEPTLMGVQVPLRARASDFEQCAGFVSVSYHTARRKCRTVCPHKELQSAFIPFITSERMRYKSLRTDKRKTLQAFFAFRLKRANPSSVRSGYIRVFRTTAFCVVSTRHLCRAFNERGARSSSRRNRERLLSHGVMHTLLRVSF